MLCNSIPIIACLWLLWIGLCGFLSGEVCMRREEFLRLPYGSTVRVMDGDRVVMHGVVVDRTCNSVLLRIGRVPRGAPILKYFAYGQVEVCDASEWRGCRGGCK